MTIEMIPAKAEHVPVIGSIAYEAFKDISDRHNFPLDFASEDFGRMVMGMLVAREDYYGAVALLDGEITGSNFLLVSDEVAGLGPITVDVPKQGGGIGRALMVDALNHARENGLEMVRLLQDSFNSASLSLYASLGFDTKAPCAVMEVRPSEEQAEGVRPMTAEDIDAVEGLSRAIYRVSRKNEVASMIGGPFRPFVRERGGRVVGYFTLGMPGHGVAETEEDMVELVREAARQAPPEMRRCICPVVEGELYRRFLAAGFRTRKVMNLMALGPYEEPAGVWLPSVGF
jgi:predicted N-acetyltransferase YhbS